jgi:hypothetical protein
MCVKAAKLLGGIHPETLQIKERDQERGIIHRIEAAADAAFEALLGVPEAA